MRALIFTGIMLMAAATTVTVQAADSAEGKSLVNENCYGCHGNDIYTRSDRRVQSRPGLSTQVRRCELALGLQWFDEDVESAAEYLNSQFYHFKK
ncbi:MAG: cytochrome c [Sedimenticola sp.]